MDSSQTQRTYQEEKITKQMKKRLGISERDTEAEKGRKSWSRRQSELRIRRSEFEMRGGRIVKLSRRGRPLEA